MPLLTLTLLLTVNPVVVIESVAAVPVVAPFPTKIVPFTRTVITVECDLARINIRFFQVHVVAAEPSVAVPPYATVPLPVEL